MSVSNEKKNRILRTIIATIREHDPPDVANVDYINGFEMLIPSLEYNTPIFCDSIIVWSLHDNKINEIRRKCREHFNDLYRIDILSVNKELFEDDIAPRGTRYCSFKISLSEICIKEVLYFINDIVSNDIILHDIDISQDVPYITTRKVVKEHLLDIGLPEELIVKDIYKVGKNCISFYNRDPLESFDEVLLKVKVYNKFVQMLESCNVRTTLGSRIHNLFVDPVDSMRKIFRRTKECGLTRIEVKVYGREVKNQKYYIDIFKKTKRRYLQGCRFYEASFESQWRKLVDEIYQDKVIMVCMDNVFAYCHWWNSITKKMQGCYSFLSPNDNLKTLVANYSFNGMNTILVMDEIKEYKRINRAITLIPGPQRGLYPQIEAKLRPRDVGIIDYKGINIGWPNYRMRSNDDPLAHIISESEDLETITRFNGYGAAYSILETYSRYQVIAKGLSEWRGKECLFIDVKNKDSVLKVRCGKQLRNLMIDIGKRVYFSTQNLVSGGRDINVRLCTEDLIEVEDSTDSHETSDEESIIDKIKRLRTEHNI